MKTNQTDEKYMHKQQFENNSEVLQNNINDAEAHFQNGLLKVKAGRHNEVL